MINHCIIKFVSNYFLHKHHSPFIKEHVNFAKRKDQTPLALSPVLLLKLPIFCYSTIIIVTKNVHYSITPFRRNTANLSYKFCNNYFNSKYHKYHSPFIKEYVLFARTILFCVPSSKSVNLLEYFNGL